MIKIGRPWIRPQNVYLDSAFCILCHLAGYFLSFYSLGPQPLVNKWKNNRLFFSQLNKNSNYLMNTQNFFFWQIKNILKQKLIPFFLFSLSGKSWIYIFSDLHFWVCHEDYSLRLLAAPDGLPAECLEFARLYHCHDWVRYSSYIFCVTSFDQEFSRRNWCHWVVVPPPF